MWRRGGLVIFFAAVALLPAASSAHVLLPKNVTQYIHDHPNATPTEIENYIQNNSPGTAKKVKSQQDVIRIVHQKTNFFDNAFDFLKLGVNHILSGPDHILFVLSFLLVFVSLLQVLKLTGTFTVAHSVTLILAGSGLLTLSSRIVEPVIAFSIAAVAISSVFFKSSVLGDRRAKIGIIFFFGLFHGLGFAGLLREIQIPKDKFISSLVSFNLGIEIGQLIIVAIALPFIYVFRNKSWYPRAIQVLAAVIGLVGIGWGLQRIVSP